MTKSGRSGAAARALIVAATVVAVAGVTAHALFFRRGGPYVTAVMLGTLLWIFGLVVILILAVVPRTGPTRLLVRAGFVVPASRAFGYFVAGLVLIAGLLGTRVVDMWAMATWTNAPGRFTAVLDFAMTVALAILTGLIGLIAGLLAVAALSGHGRLTLTPSALIFKSALGHTSVAWDAMRPGTPQRPASRLALALAIDRPELCVRRGPFVGSIKHLTIASNYADIHPWFLADVIRFYVDHPERREGIGTQAEYDHLRADLCVDGTDRADGLGRAGGLLPADPDSVVH